MLRGVRSVGQAALEDPLDQHLEQLLSLVEERRPDDAVDFIADLLDHGHSPDMVINDLLASVQLEVGRRWESGHWSVAQEHAATAVVQSALGVVAQRITVPAPRGHVVVACVEQEWHSLPARLLNERLRLRGWDTTFLGASTRAEALHEHVAGSEAHAVVASCQMGMSLPGLARAIDAVHEAGLPVVAGGAALGIDEIRAKNLGADAWTDNVDRLDAILQRWAKEPVEQTASAKSDGGEHLQLLAIAGDLVASLQDQLPEDWPTQRGDLENLVGFLAGAVVSGDDRVFGDYGCWMEGLVLARGGEPHQVVGLIRRFGELLPQELERSRRAVSDAAVRMTA